jgi:hypothetical protein
MDLPGWEKMASRPASETAKRRAVAEGLEPAVLPAYRE